MFGDGDDARFGTMGNNQQDGRFPTQLFTNVNTEKYKYVKIIKE